MSCPRMALTVSLLCLPPSLRTCDVHNAHKSTHTHTHKHTHTCTPAVAGSFCVVSADFRVASFASSSLRLSSSSCKAHISHTRSYTFLMLDVSNGEILQGETMCHVNTTDCSWLKQTKQQGYNDSVVLPLFTVKPSVAENKNTRRVEEPGFP